MTPREAQRLVEDYLPMVGSGRAQVSTTITATCVLVDGLCALFTPDADEDVHADLFADLLPAVERKLRA